MTFSSMPHQTRQEANVALKQLTKDLTANMFDMQKKTSGGRLFYEIAPGMSSPLLASSAIAWPKPAEIG